jgi:hypothetical protein
VLILELLFRKVSVFLFISFFSQMSGTGEEVYSNIKIAVRIRPEHLDERGDKRHRVVLRALDEKVIVFDPDDGPPPTIPDNYNKPKDKKFVFDVVLDQYASQRQVRNLFIVILIFKIFK